MIDPYMVFTLTLLAVGVCVIVLIRLIANSD